MGLNVCGRMVGYGWCKLILVFSLASAEQLILYTKVYNNELSAYIKNIWPLKENCFGIPNTNCPWLRIVVE